MSLTPIDFCGESWPLSATDISSERTVNFYPVLGRGNPHAMKSVSPIYLYSTEGCEIFAASSGTSVRGCIAVNEVGYFVVGSSFKKVTAAGVVTTIGTISTTTSTVIFADIFDQIMFVDGADGWIYTISTNTLTKIVDADFPTGCTFCTSLDGYFCVSDPNTQKLRISALNNGLSWAAVDYALVQSNSDNVVRIVAHLDNFWALGTRTTEQFFDSANVLFPFEPVRGAVLPFGLAASNSVAKSATGLVFLAQSERGSIFPVLVVGSQVGPVFNTGIREEISALETYSDAIGFIYHHAEHEFYVLTFPTEHKTYVYDFDTNLTHERSSLDPDSLEAMEWFPSCYMTLGGDSICGDSRSGNLMRLSTNLFTENGTRIERRRRIASIVQPIKGSTPITGVNYITLYKFILRCQTSTGKLQGQGTDPQVMLKLSRDGGRTFDVEMTRDIGTVGEFADLVIWDMLGTAKKWCAEIRVSDPVDYKILEAYIETDTE